MKTIPLALHSIAFVFSVSFAAVASVEAPVAFQNASNEDFVLLQKMCGVDTSEKSSTSVLNLTFHKIFRLTDHCTSGKRREVCVAYVVHVADPVCGKPFYISDEGIGIGLRSGAIKDSLPIRIRAANDLQRPFIFNSLDGEVMLFETSEIVYLLNTE